MSPSRSRETIPLLLGAGLLGVALRQWRKRPRAGSLWLASANAVIMAVLLLVIGVTLIGKGIGSS